MKKNLVLGVRKLVSDIAKHINDFANPDLIQNILIDFQDRYSEELNKKEV